jgi:hypothetical protein
MNETQREVPIREARSEVAETAAMPADAGIEHHAAGIRSPDVALLLGALLLLISGYTHLANNAARRHARGKPSASHAGMPPLTGHQDNTSWL